MHLILRDVVAEPGGNLFGFRDPALLRALECKRFGVSLFPSLPSGKRHPASPRLGVQVLAGLCSSAGHRFGAGRNSLQSQPPEAVTSILLLPFNPRTDSRQPGHCLHPCGLPQKLISGSAHHPFSGRRALSHL